MADNAANKELFEAYKKIVELNAEYEATRKRFERFEKHYYIMKEFYKKSVKDIVDSHSNTSFIPEKETLVANLQVLFENKQK